MTKERFLALSERERFDWMIGKGWTADVEGQVWSNRGRPVGYVNKGHGYVEIGMRLEGGTLTMLAHRFVFYFLTGEIPDDVDHISRVKHDNRLVNLRSVTHQENGFNRGAKGYNFHKPTGKWRAQIQVNGVKIHIGLYDTEDEARAAYLDAKVQYHKISEPNH
jgi:hypothetical protein